MTALKEEFFLEIKKDYPSISLEELQIFDDGWDYIVCAVDEQEVFRFPRRDDYAKTLPREVEFANIFSSQSPVTIPNMTLHHSSSGYPYVRYAFLKGQPFKFELAEEFSQSEMLIIAKQIGDFLTKLHSFPINQAKKLGLPEEQVTSEWEERFDKAKRMVFPLMSVKEQKWITQLFTDIFNVLKEPIPARLIHSDIRPRHIIVDRKEHKLVGIIDFGDVEISDPVFDFTFLGKYGQDFLKTVYQNYSLEKDSSFEKRRGLYEKHSIIAELEHAVALENKDEIEIYKNQLSEYIKLDIQ